MCPSHPHDALMAALGPVKPLYSNAFGSQLCCAGFVCFGRAGFEMLRESLGAGGGHRCLQILEEKPSGAVDLLETTLLVKKTQFDNALTPSVLPTHQNPKDTARAVAATKLYTCVRTDAWCRA